MRRGWSRVPRSAAPNGERTKIAIDDDGDQEHDERRLVERRSALASDRPNGAGRALIEMPLSPLVRLIQR